MDILFWTIRFLAAGALCTVESKLSLIVPTYNEAANVEALVSRISQSTGGRLLEILFVDDDSPDGTASLAESFSDRYPVRVIVRKEKRGLASAVIDGIKEARAGIVGAINADLQHPPEAIPALLHALDDGADIAIGSRYIPGGSCGDWTLTRRIISRVATVLVHILLPSIRRVKDPMSGFYLFRRQVIENVSLNGTGFKILLEVLLNGIYRQVAEVPYTFNTRRFGRSKLGLRQSFEYLLQIIKYSAQKGEFLTFFKFSLVGASGVFVNMAVLWLLTHYCNVFYMFAAPIAIATASFSNFVLNDRVTFFDRRSSSPKIFFQRLFKFNLVGVIGAGINMSVLYLLTAGLNMHLMLSNLAGIGSATLLRYLLHAFWTWR